MYHRHMTKYSNMSNWWRDLPTALDSVCGTAKFRVNHEDFIVDEELSFTPDGEGENIFLRIEKRGLNTEQVAKQLARFSNVKLMDVGYAGLKDKNAVTRQWFSIRIPGKTELDWSSLNNEQINIIEINRNRKKLRRGVIKQNRFEIIVQEFNGDFAELETVAKSISVNGVPNYFGDQRFGNNCGNIEKALQIFTGEYKPKGRNKGRAERSIILSAARSYLFNQILRERVRQQNWNKLLPGDVAIFDDNNSIFAPENLDELTNSRLDSMDIHPAAVLYGSGELKTTGEPNQIESTIIKENAELALGCKNNNMRLERRAMRLKVIGLTIEQLAAGQVKFSFALKTGAYATSVLREMLDLRSS